MQPSPPPSGRSLFKTTMAAANGFRNDARTPLTGLMAEMIQAGYFNPVHIVADMNVTDQPTAERLSAAIAALLTQACEDIGRQDIRIGSLFHWRAPWQDEHGRFMVALGAGTAAPDAPPITNFPAQQLVAALNNLRAEIIGKDAATPASHWQPSYVQDPAKGEFEAGYKWTATNERQRKLQSLTQKIIHLQDGRCGIDTRGPDPILWVPREDLERLAGREHGAAPPLP